MGGFIRTRATACRGCFCFAALILAGGCGHGNGNSMTPTSGPAASVPHLYVTSTFVNLDGLITHYDAWPPNSIRPEYLQPSLATGKSPVDVVVDPSNRFAYVVNVGDQTISQYSVDINSGAIQPMTPATVANSPASSATTTSTISIHPSGHFMYVNNNNDNTISQFSIGSDGRLAPMTPAMIAVPGPIAMAIDPAGHYAYVATQPFAISNAILPGGQQASVAAMYQFHIDDSGVLQPLNPAKVTIANSPVSILIDHHDKYVYVPGNYYQNLAGASAISQYAINNDGTLTATGAIMAMDSHRVLCNMKINQDDTVAYVLTNDVGVDTNDGALWSYRIDSNGEFDVNPIASVDMGVASMDLALTANAVFVLNRNTMQVGPGFNGGAVNWYATNQSGSLITQQKITLENDALPTSLAAFSASQ